MGRVGIPSPSEIRAREKHEEVKKLMRDLEKKHLHKNLSREANLKGKNAESYIRWKLEDEGYTVQKITGFMGMITGHRRTQIEKALENYKGNKEELIEFMDKNRKGLPDFMCVKDGDVKFVEVKTDGSNKTQSQEEVIPKLRDMGFDVKVRMVKVGVSMEEVDNPEK